MPSPLVGEGLDGGDDLTCARLNSIRPVSSVHVFPEFAPTVVEPSGEAGRVETTDINLRGLDTRACGPLPDHRSPSRAGARGRS